PSNILKATYTEEQINSGNEGVSVLPTNLNVLPTNLNTLPTNLLGLATKLSGYSQERLEGLLEINDRIDLLPKRIKDKAELNKIILDLCEIDSFKLNEIATVIGRNEKYLYQDYIKNLLISKNLNYKYPDMINHPDQAYLTINKTMP